MNKMNSANVTLEEHLAAMELVGDILFSWEGKSHCKPPGVTVGQAVAVTQKFMSENPELWHYPAPDLIGVALGNTWPCQKRGKDQ